MHKNAGDGARGVSDGLIHKINVVLVDGPSRHGSRPFHRLRGGTRAPDVLGRVPSVLQLDIWRREVFERFVGSMLYFPF
jgi:hypothetical protein